MEYIKKGEGIFSDSLGLAEFRFKYKQVKIEFISIFLYEIWLYLTYFSRSMHCSIKIVPSIVLSELKI